MNRKMNRKATACGIGLAAFLVALAAPAAAEHVEPGINAHRLWIYAHLLLFVFWLGADLGVFICSRSVVKPGLTPEQRLRTAALRRSIDLAPRISASLMLTVGGILTEYVGIPHPWWQMAGIVLLGPVWLILVFVGYFRDGGALGDTVAKLDIAFRALMVVAVPVSVAWSWSTGRLEAAPYVAAKLLLFALLMALGLLLSRRLRPFTDGLRALAAGRASPDTEQRMRESHAGSRMLVVLIWVGLGLAALLGIARPGESPALRANASLAALSLPAQPPRP